ncbi:MAG: hypothetical protein RMJ38_00965, partial [candidate division WOR-3 bacterium]|nr:hypothetical protein [candidate division WOR-3 bacterium]MDW8150000.1 hypothetical protein [candidate division WOR-3 bacterium]
MIVNLLIALSRVLNNYEPEAVKEWMNSYVYNLNGFTPNKGQVATDEGKEAKEVIFYTRNGNLTAYITEKGISYVINTKDNFSRIDYELIGSRIDKSKVEYYDELPGYENYYLGHCPDGILFVKSYRKVVINEVYPNINWVFRYDEYGRLHHEFEIKKGG